MGLFCRKIPDIERNLILQIIEKSITEITPYEKNPRKNDEAVEYVANSIKEFGFKVPIVIDKNGVIVAGHTRYKAAQELGLEKLPCVIADDLTEEQVKAFRLADNKVGELAEWDFDLLDGELDDIFDIDMSEFGFSFEDAKKEEKEKPEVEFSEILGEENNYLVLQFKTDIDWLNAQSIFGLETVKSYSTRKDGKVTKSMQRCGIARVLDGAQALKEILGEV